MTTFSTEELIKAFAEFDYPIAYKNGTGRGMGFSDFVKMLKKMKEVKEEQGRKTAITGKGK